MQTRRQIFPTHYEELVEGHRDLRRPRDDKHEREFFSPTRDVVVEESWQIRVSVMPNKRRIRTSPSYVPDIPDTPRSKGIRRSPLRGSAMVLGASKTKKSKEKDEDDQQRRRGRARNDAGCETRTHKDNGAEEDRRRKLSEVLRHAVR